MTISHPATLVLLPGMMCDARLFEFQIRRLEQDSGDALSIIVLPLDTADSLPELALHVLNVTPSSFALCDLSMGGIVAMDMLAQAPDRIERLALMDTNLLAETEEGVAGRNRQIENVSAGRLVQVIADEMKPFYLTDGSNKQAHLDLCMHMALSLADEALIAQSLALRDRRDQTETLKSVRCSTLILHGTEDKLCPPERHQLMKDLIPHAELVAVDGAGHLQPIKMPEEVIAHLYKWLTLF